MDRMKGTDHLREALYATILEAPDDDAPRLVYADFAQVRHLHLYDPHPESIGPLLAAPFLPRLRGLRLSAWSRSLDVDAVAALFEGSVAEGLTHLDLASFRLDVPGIRRLVRSEVAGQLESLHLHVLTDEYVRALVASDRLVNLRNLDLSGNALPTDETVRALAESPNFPRLERLSLRGIFELTDSALQALAASPHLARLVDVEVSGNGVTAAGIRALIESPNLPRLFRIGVQTRDADRLPFPLWSPSRDGNCPVVWVRDVR